MYLPQHPSKGGYLILDAKIFVCFVLIGWVTNNQSCLFLDQPRLEKQTELCWQMLILSDFLWKLDIVLKHKSYLDPEIKRYDSVDFTLT